MKKLFTILAICLICATTVHAQKLTVSENATKKQGQLTKMMTATKSDILAAKNEVVLSPGGFTMPCGTIPGGLGLYVGDMDEWITGSNPWGDVKFGYVFKGTSGSVTSVRAWMGNAYNGDVENVYAEIWAIGSNNLPTTLLGTSNPISTANIIYGDFDEYTFTFATPVNAPANFAAVITVPEYTMTSSEIVIPTTEIGCYAPGTEHYSIAYTLDEGWESIAVAWGFRPGEAFDLAIFPVLTQNSITNENVRMGFSILPNPATSNITISAGSNFHTVELVNFLGQTVSSQSNTGNTASLDVSSLTNGVYFVRITSNEGTDVKKFVKQ